MELALAGSGLWGSAGAGVRGGSGALEGLGQFPPAVFEWRQDRALWCFRSAMMVFGPV